MYSTSIRQILTFTILIFLSTSIQASDTLTVKVIATALGDSIVLRWAPINYKSWEYGITNGYKLERYTNKSGGITLGLLERHQSKVVLGNQFLPIPASAWEPLVNQDEMAGVAAGAIYGTGFLVENLTETDVMSVYNVNKENDTRFGFSLLAADQSLVIAKAMGIAFVDHTVTAGDEYYYRISFYDTHAGQTLLHSSISIVANEENGLTATPKPRATAHDRYVQLAWEKNATSSTYSGYYIERSTDNGATFTRVNDLPLIPTASQGVNNNQVHFADSLAQNGVLYVYRVLGSSSFGLEGPPSDTVHVIGIPAPIPVYPHIDTIAEVTTGTLKINWDFDVSYNNQITGFNILRSNSRNGIYTKISNALIGSTTRTWTDNSPNGTDYYKVETIDVNGHSLTSMARLGQVNDVTPPDAPENITGEADLNGLVILNWDENQEEDMMGYRVFFKNQETGEFSQVTEHWIKTNSFAHQVTLDNLSENIYYKVMAVDQRQNNSELSEVCIVARPDIIAPSAPVIRNAEAILGAVVIEWRPSSAEDVVRHELQRKADYEVSWETLGNYVSGDELFKITDTPPTVSSIYEYRCLAYDEMDLVTSSTIVKVKPIDSGERAAVSNLNYDVDFGPQLAPGIYDEDAVVCEISWDYPSLPGLHDFLIYRSLNGGPLRAYKTLTVMGNPDLGLGQQQGGGGTVSSYRVADEELRFGKTYVYKVMAQFVDGGYSPMSGQVSFGL